MIFTISYYSPFSIAWLWEYICFHTKLHCSTLQAYLALWKIVHGELFCVFEIFIFVILILLPEADYFVGKKC